MGYSQRARTQSIRALCNKALRNFHRTFLLVKKADWREIAKIGICNTEKNKYNGLPFFFN